MKRQLLACTLLVMATLGLTTLAHSDQGDRLDSHLDRMGDRIEHRLDRRGDRIDRRLDRAARKAVERGHPKAANRLDRRGDRIDVRLDRTGKRVDRRFDRKSMYVKRTHPSN